LKRVDEYLGAALDLVGDDPKQRSAVGDWLLALVPWLETAIGIGAEFAPPIKFVLALWKEHGDVATLQALGEMAFTVAYQQAAQQALEQIVAEQAVAQARLDRYASSPSVKLPPIDPMGEAYDFTDTPLSEIAQHAFVNDAQKRLHEFGVRFGLNAAYNAKLQSEVRFRFVTNLETLLSDGQTKEKFEPLRPPKDPFDGKLPRRDLFHVVREHLVDA